jgi:hypothetical protein
MSSCWFVGLHLPLLYVLGTGNTTLAHSIWPLDEAQQSGPPSQGILYVLAFASLILLTGGMYFYTAFSYPGYVDEEYRRHKSRASTLRRGASGYAQLGSAGEEDAVSSDVRITIPSIRRILVDEAAPSESGIELVIDAATGASASPSPSPPPTIGRLSSRAIAIPASMLEEASEAAELSIGCAPPVALPLLRSLGLSREQIADAESATLGDASAEQPHTDLLRPEDEEESARLNPSTAAVNVPAHANVAEVTSNVHDSAPVQSNRAASSAAPSVSGYCSACRLVRPARSKHCYQCRHCVTRFDVRQRVCGGETHLNRGQRCACMSKLKQAHRLTPVFIASHALLPPLYSITVRSSATASVTTIIAHSSSTSGVKSRP